MVRSDGKAVLIDFGIAGEIFPATVSSKSFDNTVFAPDEQMQGVREPAVNIYCLVASLYYAITGQRPASSLDRKWKKVRLVPPKQLAGGIGDELNRAILKGMELEAGKRPQSMREWLKLLESANRTQPVSPLRGRNKPVVKQLLSLTALLLSYAVCGFFSAPYFWALALALAWALAWTWACAGAWAGALDSRSALVQALAYAWVMTLVLPLYFRLVLVSALVLVFGFASILVSGFAFACLMQSFSMQSFSRFHTFLIVTGTSWLGLGLGWLVYQIFPVFQLVK